MARQSGIIHLTGTLGGINFYQTPDGFLARTKSSLTAERIARDPQFQRTRENSSEFGMASQSGKLFRQAFTGFVRELKDRDYRTRVMRLMMDLKQLDVLHQRGKRTVEQALTGAPAQELLKGFEFNSRALLSNVLLRSPVTDAAAETICIPDLIPSDDLVFPASATHVQFTAYRADLDFGTNASAVCKSVELVYRLDTVNQQVVLELSGDSLTEGVRLFVLRVRFLQEINGDCYPLKQGDYGAMRVLEVCTR
jgi:hypothetical protein